jgi:hypothetical protein
MNDDTTIIVDAELVPHVADHMETHVLTLRELPRNDDEPMLPIPATGWSPLDKALAFHRLQQEEIAKGGKFDWLDWLQSLLAAQGRKDVDGYRDLIAIGEKRGFFG